MKERHRAMPPTSCGTPPTSRFMRATKAPRDTALAATANAVAGSNLFNAIGCNICHVTSITTSAPGTVINGGALTVAAALGNKIIHPYSDFLLHNIGTGDGIVQNGGPATRNKLRTQPLWGVRTHDRHMHDGASLTFRRDPAARGRGDVREEQLQPADDDAAEPDHHVPQVAVALTCLAAGYTFRPR